MTSEPHCATCHTYWLYRFGQRVNWYGGDDDLTSRYTPLSADEGATLALGDRAAGDLAYLRKRPSWMDDRQGARLVTGAPDHPAS